MGWDWKGVGSGAMSGAGTGAMFGPWGAAAGGVAGGVLGGLKGGDKDAPPAEDFYGAATPSTQGPMGGQQWAKGPDGKWTSTMGFSGQAGNTFNALQGGMNKAANYDPTQARDAAISSNYNQAASRLDPQWQQRGQAFTSGMANQGLDPGTEAYNAQFGNESRAMNDAYSTAMANAVRQGNETQKTQMDQMNQPFNQAGQMMQMLQQGQGNNLNAPLVAAGMTQKASDNAADRAAASSGGKKGGAGSMLGGLGGKDKKTAAAPDNNYAGSWPTEM
jgi:hypothetical protein